MMTTQDTKLINFFARYAVAKCDLDLDEIRQELSVEAWLARKDWDLDKAESGKISTFIAQRLRWKVQNLIRGSARRLRLHEAFRTAYSQDFAAPPSPVFCCLSYELSMSLESVEARKVFQALQSPTELVAPDLSGTPCVDERAVASLLGISELSAKRGMREIKRKLKGLFKDEERQWTIGRPKRPPGKADDRP